MSDELFPNEPVWLGPPETNELLFGPSTRPYSVLVYPNITYAKNLSADSFVVIASNIIRELAFDDVEFTVLVPEPIEEFDMPGVRQVPYFLPTYPNTMRAHFDTNEFLGAIEWRSRSHDVVWSHLPEHTAQIKNVLYNSTNERPVFIGYGHWWEIDANTQYLERLFPQNLLGMLACDFVGVNSEWVKHTILAKAGEWLSWQKLLKLDSLIEPQYLGHGEEIVRRTPDEDPKYLVFNHRDDSYTGFKSMLPLLDRLWAKRQDWRLLVTLANADRPYIERANAPDRAEYLVKLSRCWAGLGYFRKYSAWSVSVMDGLAQGVPYILPRGFCYEEMMGESWALFYDNSVEFLAKIEGILDDTLGPLRQALSIQSNEVAEQFHWRHRIEPFREMFREAFKRVGVANPRPETATRLLATLPGTKRQITKALGWGSARIGWTPYRQWLREQGHTTGPVAYE